LRGWTPTLRGPIAAVGALIISRGNFAPALRADPREHLFAQSFKVPPVGTGRRLDGRPQKTMLRRPLASDGGAHRRVAPSGGGEATRTPTNSFSWPIANSGRGGSASSCRARGAARRAAKRTRRTGAAARGRAASDCGAGAAHGE